MQLQHWRYDSRNRFQLPSILWHILDELIPEPGSYYVMDWGYLDFARLHAFSHRLAFFVIHAKTNLRCRRINSKPVDKTTGVRANQTIVLTGINTAEHYVSVNTTYRTGKEVGL